MASVKEIATAFGYPFFAKTVIPGIIFLLVLWPFLAPILAPVLTGIGISFVEAGGAFVLLAIFIGWLISLIDFPIYMVFEGSALWPHGTAARMRSRLQERIDKMLGAAKVAGEVLKAAEEEGRDDPVRREERAELYRRLRSFPLDSRGNYKALAPTRLGNVLLAFETYPDTRFGMDAVFYWPRIKYLVNKDFRDSMSNSAAEASALVYTSLVLTVASVLYLGSPVLRAIAAVFRWSLPPTFPVGGDAWVSILVGVLLLVLAYGSYRASIQLHRNYGDMFRAAFDLLRKDLKRQIEGETTPESEAKYWSALLYRLQYLK